MSKDRILLVEGNADKLLFQELCKSFKISADVLVAAPKDYGGKYNTKGGIFTTLPLIIKQLSDGQVKHVAAVVDADHKSNNGMGFEGTLSQMTELLTQRGFTKRHRVGEGGGFLFQHDDGLNAVGVWIMPDNSSEGGTEEWALSGVVQAEEPALSFARKMLGLVPGGVKFVETHTSKAVVASWMAWQTVPGQGLHQAVREGLLDMSKPSSVQLNQWLYNVFP